jgi:glycolate oxidase FAD binding subunit
MAAATVCPSSPEEAAAALGELGREGRRLRIRGGGTKARRQAPAAAATVTLETSGLAGIRAHDAGDFTAVLGAGTRLAEVQDAFAAAGQRLALDPPLGEGDGATIGGILAAADCGPLRHRYGAGRDLVLGVTVALSDGSLARAGGRVIKNVAGYDLAKVFCGSRGALGLLTEVVVRLHPLPPCTATVTLRGADPATLTAAAAELAALPLEAECLDLGWADGEGWLALRLAGIAATARAEAVAERLTGAGGTVGVVEDDLETWSRARAAQRPGEGLVLKHSGRPSELPRVLTAARAAEAGVIARAALGLAWINLEGEDLERRARSLLGALSSCTLLEAPAELRQRLEVAPAGTGPAGLAQRLKLRFDAAGVCEPLAQWVLT